MPTAVDQSKLFKKTAMKAARTKFNAGRSKAGGGAYEQAEALADAKTQCGGDSDVFKDWLQDASLGLGLTAGQVPACNRLLQGLTDAPERWIWEKLGWQNGLSKVVSVKKASERKAALDAVRDKGRNGKLTQQKWDALLAEHCPSRETRGGREQTETYLKDEVERLKKELAAEKKSKEALQTWGKEQLRKIPPTADWTLDATVRELLGLPNLGRRRA